MKEKYYLAVDCGAESGRVMAGLWDGAKMRLEEIHRFPTGVTRVGDTMRWDITRIWGEIERGLGLAAKRFGDSIVSVGVDTWGVDYVLIDKAGEWIEQPWNYRHARTRGMLEKVKSRVSHEEIFAASGQSGGPWIDPTRTMRYVTSSETRVTGPVGDGVQPPQHLGEIRPAGWSSRKILPMSASPIPTRCMAARSLVIPSFETLSLIQ